MLTVHLLRMFPCLLEVAVGIAPPAVMPVVSPVRPLASRSDVSALQMQREHTSASFTTAQHARLRGSYSDRIASSIDCTQAEHRLIESFRLNEVSNGAQSVTALLETLETAKPPQQHFNGNALFGDWRLEFSTSLPASVREEFTKSAEQVEDLSAVLSISDSGTMDTRAVLTLLGGARKVVHLHEHIAQMGSSPFFSISDGNDEDEARSISVEVTYLSKTLLILRKNVEEHGIGRRSPHSDELSHMSRAVDVWTRYEQPSLRIRSASGLASLWQHKMDAGWRYGLSNDGVRDGQRDAGSLRVHGSLSSPRSHIPASVFFFFFSFLLVVFSAAVASGRRVWRCDAPKQADWVEMITNQCSGSEHTTIAMPHWTEKEPLAVAALVSASAEEESTAALSESVAVGVCARTPDGTEASLYEYERPRPAAEFAGANAPSATLCENIAPDTDVSFEYERPRPAAEVAGANAPSATLRENIVPDPDVSFFTPALAAAAVTAMVNVEPALAEAAEEAQTAAASGGDDWLSPFVNINADLINYIDTVLEDTLHVPNSYGFAIIGYTALIKLLTFPLNQGSLRNNAKMQMIAPKVKELQEKYKNDKETANRMMLRLYDDAGVSPLGACLPAIIQLPIFIGLYRAIIKLASTDGNRFREPFLWIPSLAGPVTQGSASLDWLLKSKSETSFEPLVGWENAGKYLILPALLIVSQILTQRMSQTPQQQAQAGPIGAVTNLFPVLIGYTSLVSPAGLGIYWLSNNLFTQAQNVLVKNELYEEFPQYKKIVDGTAALEAKQKEEERLESERRRREAIENGRATGLGAGFGRTTQFSEEGEAAESAKVAKTSKGTKAIDQRSPKKLKSRRSKRGVRKR